MSEIQTETRAAFRELLDALREADERWLSDEWGMTDSGASGLQKLAGTGVAHPDTSRPNVTEAAASVTRSERDSSMICIAISS